MMPLAPQLSVPHLGQISTSPKIRNNMKASKPKLSFSIDSIVGKRKTFDSCLPKNKTHESDLNETELLEKTIKRHFSESSDANDVYESCSKSPFNCIERIRSPASPLSNGSLSTNTTPNPPLIGSPSRSLSPLSLVTTSANLKTNNTLPVGGSFSNISQLNLNHSSNSLGIPPSPSHPSASISPLSQTNSGQLNQVASSINNHPNHQMMVAAAAAAAAASSAHQFPSLPPDYQQAAAFYPWFLRANPFASRFPGLPFDTPLGSFLLPPFRKPKRIRTAFSPGQLLKLEQAFEKNHYVVGNERKQLANHLGLSETQVKVWFQNRRTKHKRQKQEDEESGSGSVKNGDNGATSKDYSDEDEEIDLEEDEECPSDDQDQLAANSGLKFASMHHLWYQSLNAGLMAEHHPPVTSSNST